MAPGGSGAFDSPRGIFSTYAGSGYVRMPGTSMAAPYVRAPWPSPSNASVHSDCR